MSKSGEILRIGQGDYTFLCIHCGFHFQDIQEILVHIEYHFELELDQKTANLDFTNNFTDLSVEGLIDSNGAELKIEASSETKTEEELEELLHVSIVEETITEPELPEARKNKKIFKGKSKIGKKPKENSAAENLQKNLRSHLCWMCDLHFENSLEYKKHLRTAHRNSNQSFQCYMCGKFFKNFHSVKRHMGAQMHSMNKGIKCYQCESEPAIRNESDQRPHKCFLCKLWFENHLIFRIHFKDAHRKDVDEFYNQKSNCNEFTCYICQKDFLTKSYLKNHIITHNEVKPFVCDVCGKSYRTNAILTRHLNVHEGKTYTCDECGKTFPYYARLRIHRYSHRTELNYKCTVCSKAFKVQKYLARHMKMHQDVKAYACKYCGKRFTFSTGRRAHEIYQHNAI